MNIRCFIITDFISETASKLGISAERVANLAALYQSRNPNDGDITFEKISQTYAQEKNTMSQVDTLIPMYKTVEYDPQKNITSITSRDAEGNIILTKLPKDSWNSIFMHLFDKSKNKNEIQKYVTTREEAYRFAIWREMFYIQRGVLENKETADFAEKAALEKLITYKRLQSEGVIPQKQEVKTEEKKVEQPVKTIVYTPKGKEQQTYTIKGTQIFNKDGKEVFKENSIDRNKIFANLAVQEGRAVVVSYKDAKYVVNNKGDIISVATGKMMQWGEENGDRRNIIALAQAKFITNQNKPTSNNYEVSTAGDKRFSALNATFKEGTIIEGIDVGGKTIEYVYQNIFKKSGRGKAPAKDSILYNPELKTEKEQQDFSYTRIYLPLWQEWAKQNPELIEDLREKAKGKVLTDQFANTRVSQARALADILNQSNSKDIWPQSDPLSSILQEKLQELGIQIKEADLGEGVSGKFVANEHTIYYNPNSIQGNTIIHEAIHAVSTYYLNITDQESLPKNIKTAIKEINYCYDLLKDAYIKENFYKDGKPKKGVDIKAAFNFWINSDQASYGLNSPSEMIAELTNPEFIEYIRKVDAKYKGKNIFQKLIDSILEFFKTNKEYKSIEKTVKEALLELINNPNKQLLDNYAKETQTVKDNLKKIKESTFIVLEKAACNAILEKLESLPEDITEASIEITLDIDSINDQWSMRFPKGTTKPLTGSNKGALMVYEESLIAVLDGNVTINNDNNTVTIPLKVYSLEALSTHELTIKNGNNGISYIESYTPIYNTNILTTKVETFSGNWSREEVAKQTDKVFLFGDNTNDRINTHYVPSMTQAVIRGLPNAIGIDTKKNRGTTKDSYFTDADFDIFKTQVDNAIQQAINSGKTIVIPEGGIGTGKAQLQQRAPKLFNYLQEQLNKLQQKQLFDQTSAPEEFTNHSGGAYGADTLWDTIGRRFGVVNHKHYRDSGNTKLSNTLNKSGVTATALSSEQMETARIEIKKLLGVLYPNTTEGNLQVRNYYQVINSNGIYAIATLNKDSNGVTGGTNTAVQLGIKLNKPVYVWDLNTESWYKFDGKQFVITDTPTLTRNFAGVGTRDIENYKVLDKESNTWKFREQYVGDEKSNKAKQAIQDVYAKTFNTSLEEQPIQESIQNDLKAIDELFDNAPSGNVIRSFQITPEKLAAIQQEQQSQEEDDVDLPTPGVDVLDINKEHPLAQLYQDLNSAQRRDRTTMLQEVFSEVVSRELKKKIKQIGIELSNENSKENPDQNKVDKLNNQLISYQDSAKGRKRFIQDTPIRELFNLVKQEIQDYKDESDTDYEIDAYEKVLKHFDILMTNACTLIESIEGIRIIPEIMYHNDGNKTEKTLGGTTTATVQDQEDLDAQTDDDPEGNRATGNDGWSFKIREMDPRTTLSQKVKKLLASIALPGVQDDLGRQRYLGANTAHAILVNELSWMVKPEDFYNPEGKNIASKFPALNKIKEKYPWVKGLMSELNSDPILLTQFYVDFRKDFAAFIKIKQEKILDLNLPVAIDSVISKINRNYEQGILLDKDSIYNQSLGLRKESKEIGTKLILDIKEQLNEDDLSKEQQKEVIEKTVKLLKMLGYNATNKTVKNILTGEDGINNLNNLISNISVIFDNFKEELEDGSIHIVNSAFKTPYTNIAEIIGEIDELDNTQTFREGGKDRPSYVAPNYISTLIKKLKRDDLRKNVLQQEFKDYSFFYDKEKGKWKNEWLRLIEKDRTARNKLKLVELKHIFEEKETKEYEDWTSNEIRLGFITAFFAEGLTADYGYYHMPIFSDSPITMMIKFKRYNDQYEERLLPLFRQLVHQELERIKLVQSRREGIKNGDIKEIVNFDKNGDKFHFIPFLNKYKVDGKSFLEAISELKEDTNLTEIDNLIDKAIKDYMEDEYQDLLYKFSKNFDILKEMFSTQLNKKASEIKDSEIKDLLREYLWNSEFATSQIIQLTVTDPAFFKDTVDFQKRFKQVYAAGNKLNTNSRYGKKIEKVVYLADLEMTSQTFDGVKKILQKAVKDGRISAPVAKGMISKFKNINATDAQAFRSPQSLRSVYDMLGMWTEEMETALNHFKDGTWTGEDFDVIWQTIKPFTYTQISKPSGTNQGNIKVPHQNKNSEFVLLATFNYIAAATSESPQLKALVQFMESNDIDVVMFESAVKNGGQGIININYSVDKLNKFIQKNPKWTDIEEAARKELKDKFDKADDYTKFKKGNDYLLENDKITQDEYNKRFSLIDFDNVQTIVDVLNKAIRKNNQIDPEVVHEIPYDDYMVQQPTPEHLFDTVAKYGSQFRNLIVSDLPDNFEVTINGKKYNKQQLLKFYDSLIIENLLDDFEKVKEIFGSIETLQQDLLNKVKGNPKYGREFTDALELVPHPTDPTKKVFNLPPSSPSITEKFQELILSVFKNKITKQEIKGGNAILVSNFGLTRKLKIQYKEDGGLKGVECYLPAYSKKFYEPFIDKNTGELQIDKMPEELKKLVGYRIPTEGKYSMIPLIVKGFLPQQNGSAIMLPADITTIAGSDFDVKIIDVIKLC